VCGVVCEKGRKFWSQKRNTRGWGLSTASSRVWETRGKCRKVCGNVSGRVWSSVRKESAVEENVWTGMWAGTSNGSIHVRRRGRVKVGGRVLGVEVNTNGDLDQSACEIFMCLVAEGNTCGREHLTALFTCEFGGVWESGNMCTQQPLTVLLMRIAHGKVWASVNVGSVKRIARVRETNLIFY
jgi:hypothetical protein